MAWFVPVENLIDCQNCQDCQNRRNWKIQTFGLQRKRTIAEENGVFGQLQADLGTTKQFTSVTILAIPAILAMLAISRSRLHNKKAWIKFHPGHSTGKIYN